MLAIREFLSRTLVALTLLCFLSLSYFIFNSNYSNSRVDYPWLYFLVGFLFFNTTHIFITFISLKFLPEFNGLSFLHKISFKFRCFSIFLCTSLLTYFCLKYSAENETLFLIFRVFVYATTIHHTVMQTYGLSSQVNLTAKSNRIEKNMVLAFTSISIIMYGLIRFDPQINLVISFLVLVLLWFAISIRVLREMEVQKRFTKFVFLSRYLCLFLCFVHPIYTLLTMTFHGFEYLHSFLGNRMNSSIGLGQSKKIAYYLWVFVPLAALLTHSSLLFANLPITYRTFFGATMVLESIIMGLNLLHYFLDAKIYEFRNKEVRDNISVLFQDFRKNESLNVLVMKRKID